jgi:hypothetical protein
MNAALLAFAVAVAAAALGFFGGMHWQQGREAVALQEAHDKLRDHGRAADITATNYAAEVTRLSLQLGSTRAQLFSLSSGRDCLSGPAVRLLNDSSLRVPSTAGEPARAPEAAATDRDVGDALAICRASYERVSAQLNSILDIEDSRQRLGGGAAAMRFDEAATQPPPVRLPTAP